MGDCSETLHDGLSSSSGKWLCGKRHPLANETRIDSTANFKDNNIIGDYTCLMRAPPGGIITTFACWKSQSVRGIGHALYSHTTQLHRYVLKLIISGLFVETLKTNIISKVFMLTLVVFAPILSLR